MTGTKGLPWRAVDLQWTSLVNLGKAATTFGLYIFTLLPCTPLSRCENYLHLCALICRWNSKELRFSLYTFSQLSFIWFPYLLPAFQAGHVQWIIMPTKPRSFIAWRLSPMLLHPLMGILSHWWHQAEEDLVSHQCLSYSIHPSACLL